MALYSAVPIKTVIEDEVEIARQHRRVDTMLFSGQKIPILQRTATKEGYIGSRKGTEFSIDRYQQSSPSPPQSRSPGTIGERIMQKQ